MDAEARERYARLNEAKAAMEDKETHSFAKRNAAVYRFRAWVARAEDGERIPQDFRTSPCACTGCECHDGLCHAAVDFVLAGQPHCELCYRRLTAKEGATNVAARR